MKSTITERGFIPAYVVNNHDDSAIVGIIDECGRNLAAGIGCEILEDLTEHGDSGVYAIRGGHTYVRDELGVEMKTWVDIENITDDFIDLEETHDVHRISKAHFDELENTWYVRMAEAHKCWFWALWSLTRYPVPFMRDCLYNQ